MLRQLPRLLQPPQRLMQLSWKRALLQSIQQSPRLMGMCLALLQPIDLQKICDLDDSCSIMMACEAAKYGPCCTRGHACHAPLLPVSATCCLSSLLVL